MFSMRHSHQDTDSTWNTTWFSTFWRQRISSTVTATNAAFVNRILQRDYVFQQDGPSIAKASPYPRFHYYDPKLNRRSFTPVICHFLGVGNLESIFLVLRYLPNYDFSIFWTSSKCHRNHRTYFRMFPFAPQPPCRVATVPETLSSLMNCQIGSLGH